MVNKIYLISIVLMLSVIGTLYAQTDVYQQSWFEISSARVLKGKWALEGIASAIRSSKPNERGMFDLQSNHRLALWGHYFASARYKFSAQIGYFNNKNVPDLSQEESKEIRFSPQVIYYFHKTGYTFTTRTRLEARFLESGDDEVERVYRYRQQVHFVYPFNSRVIREGVYYGIVSDELYFKSTSDVSGKSFFDRNRFTIGGGYAISDNFQVELTYINEYLPRNSVTQVYHNMKVTLAFNNLFAQIKNSIGNLKNKNTGESD
jgi:uncharacterized protein DUF2490